MLSCVREKTTINEAGLRLEANAERHLKRASEMARLFRGHAAAVARTFEIMEACTFSLDELVYEYPDEPTPPGKTPQAHLEDLAWEGARWRFPDGIPDKVRSLITRELELIAELNYAPYFLTVHDIVRYARSQEILCQGRGSAANSAVCYCLAITAVNPTEIDLLFERFVSPERKEPPDIDVDFEHERREEVIQYIYARYGRDRAGIAATVISYRARSAVRDVGKAMGLSEDTVAALAGMVWGTTSGGELPEKHVRAAGLDPADPLLTAVLELTHELMGFPRHLSQHVGGFVLDARAAGRGRPRRQRGHAGPHLHRVGQGRHRRARALEGRRSGPRHAHLHPPRLRSHRQARGQEPDARLAAARGRSRLRHAVPRGFDRRVPGREPRADEHAAAPEAALLLRPRHRGGDRAPGTHPG